MLIQVGELAKRAGITVRTLHHYEQTGVLLPSARSAAGYRLYNLADVQRLHMIQALAKAGLELAEIRDFLEQKSLSLTELLDAQISLLDKQLRSINTLRDRLVDLRTGLTADETPDLESWLQTLELMNMYDRWFTKEELQQRCRLRCRRMRWQLSGRSWLQRSIPCWNSTYPLQPRGRWTWPRAGWNAWSRTRQASRSF